MPNILDRSRVKSTFDFFIKKLAMMCDFMISGKCNPFIMPPKDQRKQQPSASQRTFQSVRPKRGARRFDEVQWGLHDYENELSEGLPEGCSYCGKRQVCCESCCGCFDRLSNLLQIVGRKEGNDPADVLHRELRSYYEQDPDYAVWTDTIDQRVAQTKKYYDKDLSITEKSDISTYKMNCCRLLIHEFMFPRDYAAIPGTRKTFTIANPLILPEKGRTSNHSGLGLILDQTRGFTHCILAGAEPEGPFAQYASELEGSPLVQLVSVNGSAILDKARTAVVWRGRKCTRNQQLFNDFLASFVEDDNAKVTIQVQRVKRGKCLLNPEDMKYLLEEVLVNESDVQGDDDDDILPDPIALLDFFDFDVDKSNLPKNNSMRNSEQHSASSSTFRGPQHVSPEVAFYFQRHLRSTALARAGLEIPKGTKAKLVVGAEQLFQQKNKILMGRDWGIVLATPSDEDAEETTKSSSAGL